MLRTAPLALTGAESLLRPFSNPVDIDDYK